MSIDSNPPRKAEPIRWQPIVARYARSDTRRSLWQMANTLIPYFVLWGLMISSIRAHLSYWITLGMAVLAAGFLMRTFIIFHDCGHGSFFKSKRANDIVGSITGFLNFTPYYRWKHDHAIHHATAGDLDRRGVGDVYTMTVQARAAAARGRTVLYSTQLLDVTERFSDRVCVIHPGEIRAFDTLTRLREQARDKDNVLEEMFRQLREDHG